MNAAQRDLRDAELLALLSEFAEDAARAAKSPERFAAELAPRLIARRAFGLPSVGGLRLAWLLLLIALTAALAVALAVGGFSPRPGRLVKIGVELPLGAEHGMGDVILDAVRLALQDTGGTAGAYQIVLPNEMVLSDFVDGLLSDISGAHNIELLAADPGLAGVIGPFDSGVAAAEIPVSNEAGLLQCSPANTAPDLTRSPASLGIVLAHPERRSYVRVVSSDDATGRAAASYLAQTLGLLRAYVLLDNTAHGTLVGDAFQRQYEALGGALVGRDTLPDTGDQLASLVQTIRQGEPQVIFVAVSGRDGARVISLARHAAIKGPFVGTDALFDGWPQGTDTALSDSDARAGDILLAFPAGGESSVMARFRDRYRAQVGGAAPAFAATGYACVEVIQQALEMADSVALTDGLAVREAVRAAVVGDNTFTTILGPLRFDGNGDTVPQTVSIYKFDPDLHDWTFVTSIDT